MALFWHLLRYLLRTLLLLTLLLTLAGGWLLASEPGLRWLLEQSRWWLPEGAQLQVGEVNATLWQGGSLHEISYRDADRAISAARLTLAWQPQALRNGELQLDAVTLQDARYQWLGGGEPSPWQAGDLDLPVTLSIARLSLQRGAIIIGEQGTPLLLHNGELSGRWTRQAITVSRLQLWPASTASGDANNSSADGSLSMQASLQLDQQLGWQTRITLDKLDPALLSSELSGDISGVVGLAGRLATAAQADTLHGLLQLQPLQLQGQLNGHPLSASGSLQSGPQGIQVQQLQLRSGDAEFSAQGAFRLPDEIAGIPANPTSAALQWQLKVPRLRQLLAGARGRINARGELSGSGDKASVQGQLTVRDAALQELRATRLDADFTLRADAAAASSVSIKGSGLALGETGLKSLSAHLKGPLVKHSLSLNVQQSAGKLALQGNGGFDLDSRQWAGSIAKLTLQLGDAGDWSLGKHTSLKLAAQRVDTGQLCLQRVGAGSAGERASLCAKLSWRPHSGSLDASLKQLPLLALRPLVGDAIQQLSGAINGKLHVGLTPVPTGSAKLTVTPGELSVRLDRYRQLKIAHHGANLDAKLAPGQLEAQWHLKVGEHSNAEGDLAIARPALERDPANAAIRGRIKLDLSQAGLIDAFFPNVREAEGSLKARLQLGGSLSEPAVSGTTELQAGHALLPMAGVALSDLRLNLHGNGSRQLNISGGVTSGPGRVDLSGKLLLDPARGWPLHLKLSGERVQALDLPQVTALVSPDLSVETDEQRIKVRGSIVIPEGQVRLRSLPEQAVSESSDVVIVSHGDKAAAKDATGSGAGVEIDASVEVRLGKKVSFKGFGLDGRLSGHIRLSQQPGKLLSGKGELGVNNATLFFLGERLDVERARLLYIGGPLDAPGLNVRASRDVNDTEVGVTITGTIKDPTITGFASDPGITSRDALAILATGMSPDDPGFDQAARSTAASIGAMALTNPIASKTGLDQVAFRSGTEDAADASVYVGKNLTQDLNVGVSVGVQDSREDSQFVTRYKLRRNLYLEAHTSSGGSGLDLKYTIELK